MRTIRRKIASRQRPMRPSPRGRVAAESLEGRTLLSGATLDLVSAAELERAAAKGKVSPALVALAAEEQGYYRANPSPAPAFQPANEALAVAQGRVAVKAVAAAGVAVKAMLKDLMGVGFVETMHLENQAVGSIPLASVGALAGLASLKSASPAYKPQKFIGLTTTQGDRALQADVARTQFGLDGTGVKVGVISDSYNRRTNAATTASQDIASNDLPPAAKIQILDDSFTGGSDEGRAMMQLIHDIAPGASLAFHTAVANTGAGPVVTDATIASAILDLAAAGCDIIVDDIGGPDEPMYMDGRAARAIDTVVGQGVAYFTSAANGGRTGYFSAYRNSGTTITIDGVPVGTAHDFDSSGAVDFRQGITIQPGRGAFIEFQWDQPFGSITGKDSANDLDIFLVDTATNTLVASSEDDNTSSGTGDPVEALFFGNNTASSNFEIIITLFSGTGPTRMKYVNRQSTLNIVQFDTNSGTLFGHQNARLGAAVGAAPWFQTPEFNVNPPVIETFSSVGGQTIVFDNAGNRLTTPLGRNQPRFTATDGGNTTFFGNDITQDTDTRPNFFGTSAAAPEAAAVAALMFDRSPNATPQQIYTAMENTAIDMDDPFTANFQTGYDFTTGRGLIQADDAINALGNQPTNQPPAIGTFTDSPDPVTAGGNVTLTAGSVTDPNGNATVDNVTFYRESNGTAGLQVGSDTEVGTDTASPFSAVINTAALTPATYTYYARATDNAGAVSPVKTLTNRVNAPVGTARINGTVFRDNDGDKVRDTGEPGMASVRVFLDQNQNRTFDTGERSTLTSSTGTYSFTSLAAGTYYVAQVVPTGFQQTFPDAGGTGTGSAFKIDVVFPDNTLTAAQKAVFTTAANRWAQIITGDVPNVSFNGRTIDDLEIEATGPAIDGPGGILGQAGPTNFRSTSFIPFRGIMRFDSADIAALEQAGQFVDVILHEMGHVLGIGTIWDDKGLLSGAGGSNPQFTGTQATAAYRAIFDLPSAPSVPVENTGGGGTRDSHFRESTFNNELMTGFLNSPGPNPLSRITAGSLGDLGYQVNLAAADTYTKPGSLQASSASGSAVIGRIETIDVDPASPGATHKAEVLASLAFTHTVNLASGQIVNNINFGNRPVTTGGASISGTKFNDLDGDGIRDAGEPGLANFRIFLDGDNDGVFDSTEKSVLTAADGTYTMENVSTTGTKRVREVQQSGFRRTLPSAAGYDFTITAGQQVTGRDFGNTRNVLISGTVFTDSNNNKVRDSGEAAQANRRVYLDLDNDGAFDSTEPSVLSSSTGTYAFKGRPAGTYRVRIVRPTGFTVTTPTGGLFTLTLTSGQTATGRNFGLRAS